MQTELKCSASALGAAHNTFLSLVPPFTPRWLNEMLYEVQGQGMRVGAGGIVQARGKCSPGAERAKGEHN